MLKNLSKDSYRVMVWFFKVNEGASSGKYNKFLGLPELSVLSNKCEKLFFRRKV